MICIFCYTRLHLCTTHLKFRTLHVPNDNANNKYVQQLYLCVSICVIDIKETTRMHLQYLMSFRTGV
uniref:Uncharacterized protein n=1 Tax=Arundo donax TaxID=35708 RepID=A0A0A8ZTL5_ARUDO